MKNEIEWDFDTDSFDQDAYEESLRKYVTPIEKHECTKACTDGVSPYYHERQDIWDDFKLSQKQREKMNMEVISARGRDNKERTLIRQFQSTLDGSYVLRLQTVSDLTIERFGDIFFDEKEDIDAYYNYAIDVFGFDKGLKALPPTDEDFADLFEAPDEFDDLFEGLDEVDDDLFDIDDDDDEGLWD